MHLIDHTYILNVEAVVLRIAESSIHRLNDKVLIAFVTEANKQFHRMTSWQICETYLANKNQWRQTQILNAPSNAL